MTTQRRFCRFRNDWPEVAPFGVTKVPDGGHCLCVFLVLVDRENPTSVLMGKPNPDAEWDHLGSIFKAEAERCSKFWNLPASHMIFGESPHEGAKRVALEQLGLRDFHVPEPVIANEYDPDGRNPNHLHWDLEFIFKTTLERIPRKPGAWLSLEYVDMRTAKRSDICRSHDWIIEQTGIKLSST